MIYVLLAVVAVAFAFELYRWLRAHRAKLDAEADHLKALAQAVEDHAEANVAHLKAQTQQLVDRVRRDREAETPPAPVADEPAQPTPAPAVIPVASPPPTDSTTTAVDPAPSNSATKSTVLT